MRRPVISQTENTQATRQIRFTNVREIVEMEPILKAYVYEAIETENAGLKVNYKKTTEFIMPEEFQKGQYLSQCVSSSSRKCNIIFLAITGQFGCLG